MDFIPTEIIPTIDNKMTYPMEFKLIWEVDDQPDFSKLPPAKKLKYIQSYNTNQWRMLKLTIIAKYGAHSGIAVRYNIASTLPRPKLQQIVDDCAHNAKLDLATTIRDKLIMIPIVNWTPNGPQVHWKLPA